MARLSSELLAPRSSLLPAASVAHSSARFVMLFEPANATVASGGAANRSTARTSPATAVSRPVSRAVGPTAESHGR
jgi:hypothetical protein